MATEILDSEPYKFVHDLSNSIASVYGSLLVIQNRHPEVTGFKYWQETMEDMEEIRSRLFVCLADCYKESGIKENT